MAFPSVLARPDTPTPSAAPDAETAPVGRSLPMMSSSIGMITGRAASMGLGFLFWLVAARLFSASVVGLTAGATSAIMLCGQLALPGIGTALMARYPQHLGKPARLLDTTFSIAAAAGLFVGVLFLILARGAFAELGVVASRPLFALLFLTMSMLGTLGYVFDLVSMAQGRGDHVIARNTLNGVVTILPLALIPLFGVHAGSQELFGFWVVGALGAVVLGLVQFGRGAARYRFRPRVDRGLAAGLVREGISNQVLVLGENAPGLILAVAVTEMLSPAANAYWYTVWMMAFAVYVIPISIGVALFSEGVNRPETLRHQARRALKFSLGLGVPAAAALAALAGPVLSLLGADYAAAGAAPLRILVIGVLPLAFIQTYVAVCRSTGRLSHAVGTGMVGLVGGISMACAGGLINGLPGMAAGWVGAQCLLGVWAATRTHRLLSAGNRSMSLLEGARPATVMP
jgi:O-antigen/teichoic acid export membrane protein